MSYPKNPLPLDLRFASNLHGALSADVQQRLTAYQRCPCRDHWDDVQSIILNADRMLTVWQAVLVVDPTFPSVGKLTDQHGRVLEDWSTIPSRETFMEAIYYATH